MSGALRESREEADTPVALDFIAQTRIYASYPHPAVHTGFIIAPPAEIRDDELPIETLERVVHRVVGWLDAFFEQPGVDDGAIQPRFRSGLLLAVAAMIFRASSSTSSSDKPLLCTLLHLLTQSTYSTRTGARRAPARLRPLAEVLPFPAVPGLLAAPCCPPTILRHNGRHRAGPEGSSEGLRYPTGVSLTVTVCVSYGNHRTAHWGTAPSNRPDT
jgi:hypothetical protein